MYVQMQRVIARR